MIKLDFAALAEIVGGELLDKRFNSTFFEGVSIDSRTISPRQLFIAIRGEKTDGHKYISDAISRGAAGLMLDRRDINLTSISKDSPILIVPDTHGAMIRLASGYRAKLSADIIAITGSNGKTTTKEIAFAIIASKYSSTYRSPGNLNNLFGLPLAIFSMPYNTRYGVFELGISIPGEMTRLAGMLHPDIAVITNIGPTHLETLGTVENVAEAKLELVDSIGASKPAIINADEPVLVKAARRRNRKYITYGIDFPADFTARRVGISDDGFPVIEIEGTAIKIRLFGDHQIYNILAGFALARTLGINIDPEELNHINYQFAPYRGEIENIHSLTIIADCYNANPVSMQSGLETFSGYLKNSSMRGRRGIAVLGDMLELGSASPEYHREIGKLLARLDFPMTIAVGPLSRDMYEAALQSGLAREKIMHFEEVDAAAEYLLNNSSRNDVVYFKASRGIGLEKIITLLKGAAFRQN